MKHLCISPYYPQSNGKIERWNQSVKRECIRPGTPLSLDDARQIVEIYVDRYNNAKLHSTIGYVSQKNEH
ncbi:MAG: transposase [candidate division Zixibacteria bacterium]|nr:transposase [Candidatus Tariuqbacter arcticus]